MCCDTPENNDYELCSPCYQLPAYLALENIGAAADKINREENDVVKLQRIHSSLSLVKHQINAVYSLKYIYSTMFYNINMFMVIYHTHT